MYKYKEYLHVFLGKIIFLVFIINANEKGDIYINIRDLKTPGHFSNHASRQRHEKQKGGMAYRAGAGDNWDGREIKLIYSIGFSREHFIRSHFVGHNFSLTPPNIVNLDESRGLMFDFYIAPLKDIKYFSPVSLTNNKKIFEFNFKKEKLLVVSYEGSYGELPLNNGTLIKSIPLGKIKKVAPGKYETEPFMINGDYF